MDFEPAKLQQQSRAYREIQDNTIIAIDIGDITKPSAKQLECLAPVADGSDNHKIKPGYWLIGAVAVNPWTLKNLRLGLLLAENKPLFHARKTAPFQPCLFSVEHDL